MLSRIQRSGRPIQFSPPLLPNRADRGTESKARRRRRRHSYSSPAAKHAASDPESTTAAPVFLLITQPGTHEPTTPVNFSTPLTALEPGMYTCQVSVLAPT